MSDEKRCDCCKRYWYVDDLVSGLCPNCLDFLATKNQMDIEQDQKIKALEYRLSNCIEPKEDYYVIVSNGWKNKKYGIAKVQQVVENYYIQETDEYLGSYSADTEYGEFATLEEAKAKLREIQNGN